jgi:hypothetical protein
MPIVRRTAAQALVRFMIDRKVPAVLSGMSRLDRAGRLAVEAGLH